MWGVRSPRDERASPMSSPGNSRAGGDSQRTTPRDRWSAQHTPRTPRTPRTPGRSPRTPRTPRTSARSPRDGEGRGRGKSNTAAWGDDDEEEVKKEEEEDSSEVHHFWALHWEAAGYVKNEDGEYVKRREGDTQIDPPTMDALHEEERKQQLVLKGIGTDEGDDTGRTAGGPGGGALAEYARIGDVDKAMGLLQSAERSGNLYHVINAQDRFGWTAMHWACEGSEEDMGERQRAKKLTIAKTLVNEYRSSLDLNIKTGRGNTALVHAVWNGNLKAVQTLLKKKGSDVNSCTEYGWTALHWAANGRRGSEGVWHPLRDVLQVLLRRAYEANVNAASLGGDTPLHIACMRGFWSVAEMLMLAGADVKRGNANGMTPLHVAVTNGHHNLIAVLLTAGASGYASDRRGRTPGSILCSDIVTGIKHSLFPNYSQVDFVERRDIDARFKEWLRERELSPRLLTPSIDASDVLILGLPECHQNLLRPPQMLDLDGIDELESRLKTLRMLQPTAVAGPYPVKADKATWEVVG
mmetsp:Transcript_24266/g.56314  ORF Transcript_24266/g.56314 Transcript_24266/m.56314 type:complete len:524 (-) Transcript_24266:17-1588(-)